MEPNRPSRAKAFFDEIKLPEHGPTFLEQLTKSEGATFESEFLEFKGGHEIKTDGEGLLQLWAKNLSCFANSDGGVLIFGIHAPKGVAKSLSLVQDLGALCERLKNLLPRITEPPVQRVEIEAFPVSPGSNAGFVVCFIPPSPWRPHQIRVNGQPGQFYVRAADNCIPCNHATLRALFAPQFVSVMEIQYQWILRPQVVTQWKEAHLQFWIENKGPATARETFVRYKWDNFSPSPSYDGRLWEEAQTGHKGWALSCKRSIHPGERVPLASFPLGLIDNTGSPQFQQSQSICWFSISAHNQPAVEFEIKVPMQNYNDTSLKKAIPVEINV
jgi:hypothetical protein